MGKQHFSIGIDAPPREKVWNVHWGKTSYPAWTSVFAEGSSVETDWKKGSKALFLDETEQGIVSTIANARPLNLCPSSTWYHNRWCGRPGE